MTIGQMCDENNEACYTIFKKYYLGMKQLANLKLTIFISTSSSLCVHGFLPF